MRSALSEPHASREQALNRLFVLGKRLDREGRLLADQVASVRGELDALLIELGRLQKALREERDT